MTEMYAFMVYMVHLTFCVAMKQKTVNCTLMDFPKSKEVQCMLNHDLLNRYTVCQANISENLRLLIKPETFADICEKKCHMTPVSMLIFVEVSFTTFYD